MVIDHNMTRKNEERTNVLLMLGFETLVVVAEEINMLFVMLQIVKSRFRCEYDEKCTKRLVRDGLHRC